MFSLPRRRQLRPPSSVLPFRRPPLFLPLHCSPLLLPSRPTHPPPAPTSRPSWPGSRATARPGQSGLLLRAPPAAVRSRRGLRVGTGCRKPTPVLPCIAHPPPLGTLLVTRVSLCRAHWATSGVRTPPAGGPRTRLGKLNSVVSWNPVLVGWLADGMLLPLVATGRHSWIPVAVPATGSAPRSRWGVLCGTLRGSCSPRTGHPAVRTSFGTTVVRTP